MHVTNSASKAGTSRIAQSQPGSRSTSPTPKFSYLINANNNSALTSPSYGSSRNFSAAGAHHHHHYQLNNSENNQNYIQQLNIHDLASSPPDSSYGNGGHAATIKANPSRSANVSMNKSKIPTSSRNSSRDSSPGRRSSKTIDFIKRH